LLYLYTIYFFLFFLDIFLYFVVLFFFVYGYFFCVKRHYNLIHVLLPRYNTRDDFCFVCQTYVFALNTFVNRSYVRVETKHTFF